MFSIGGSIGARCGKDYLNVTLLFGSLSFKGEYCVVNLAHSTDQKESNEGIPTRNFLRDLLGTFLLPGAPPIFIL